MDSALDGRDEVIEALNRLLTEIDAGETWENDTLARYFEALAALLGSIENHFTNTGQALPSSPWTLMAHALEGARFYE